MLECELNIFCYLDSIARKFRPNRYHRGVLDRSSRPPATKDGTQTGPGADEIYQTDVSEVWFAGCHSGSYFNPRSSCCSRLAVTYADFGGGSAANFALHPLSIITVRLVVEQCV